MLMVYTFFFYYYQENPLFYVNNLLLDVKYTWYYIKNIIVCFIFLRLINPEQLLDIYQRRLVAIQSSSAIKTKKIDVCKLKLNPLSHFMLFHSVNISESEQTELTLAWGSSDMKSLKGGFSESL